MIRRDALPSDHGQREHLAEWDASMVASGLPIAGLDAPKPRARVVMAAPLSIGTPGEAELADLWLVERMPRWRVREALVTTLPPWYRLVDLYDIWLGESPLPGRVVASVYRAVVRTPVEAELLGVAAHTLLAAETLPRQRRKGESKVSYDLRPFLAAIDVTPEPGGLAVVRMTLRHDPAKGVGRPDETIASLADAVGQPLEIVSLIRERLVLAEPVTPEPSVARGPRRPQAARSAPHPQPGPPRSGDRPRGR